MTHRLTHLVALPPDHVAKVRLRLKETNQQYVAGRLGCTISTLDRILGTGLLRPHVVARLSEKIATL